MFKNLLGRLSLLLVMVVVVLPGAKSGAQTTAFDPVELRVMTFNIWVGGELVDFGKVIEAIQASKADVVGLQETGGNIRRIAAALGWQYVSERMAVISRFPLIDLNSGKGNAIFVQVKPGQMVAMANTHLPSDPYGPYLVRDGEPLDKVLENEETTRMEYLKPVLAGLSELIVVKIPVILTGDFNTPSHLDWTEAGAKVRRQKAYPVEWPVTKAIIEAGFKDTYRTAHPDPVAKQGNTWSYGYPVPRLRENETIDRIDMVFATSDVEVTASQIVGEAGGPDVDIPIVPFPSDHRGVVTTVKVRPVVPPLFVSFDKHRIAIGEPFVVRYHAPQGEATDRIVIVGTGDNATTSALMSLPPYEADIFGSVTFGSGGLKAGRIDAVLVGAGDKELARSWAWVVDGNAPVTVVTDKTSYKPDDRMSVAWENTPGNRADWIGIYKDGETDLYNYLGFLYTEGRVGGVVTFDLATLSSEKLAPGNYRAAVMLDDGYALLGSVGFKVVP